MSLVVQVRDHRVITREAVRAPHLFRLRCGDLLLTCHIQADSHFAERRALRSRDGGRTWQAEARRAHHEQANGEGADGLVLAPDNYTFERRPGEYLGSFFRSIDGGVTFTGPHESVIYVNRVSSWEYPTREHVPDEGHVQHKFYQPLPAYYEPMTRAASRRIGPGFFRDLLEHRGRWLAPMQCNFHGDRKHRTILVASGDAGRTWRYLSTIAFVYDRPDGDGYCEPALIETPDGGLLCVMRWGGGAPLGQCRSLDGGATWSEVEKLAGHGVDPDLCLMENGVLACTYGRPGQHIMFSEDGCGYAWGYRTALGDWRGSGYTGMVEIAPGELLVAYDRNEAGPGEDHRDPAKCLVGAVRLTVEVRARRTVN